MSHFLIFAALFLFWFRAIDAAEIDCLYNKCEWKLNPANSRHVPCMDTSDRVLIRDVECNDGVTYHICCLPVRPEIQKSRQIFFRGVTRIGNMISMICTKRILCEQACKDGLKGDARTDYPEVLESDSEVNREYVQAYRDGENQVCYGHSTNTSSTSKPYDSAACVQDCSKKFPTCEEEINQSIFVKGYYDVSERMHKLGMWVFNSLWLTLDGITWTIENIKKFKQIVKAGYTKLLNRMTLLKQQFEKYLVKDGNKRLKRSSFGNMELGVAWKSFLITYNETDPKLVECVYEAVDFYQFTNYTQIINETLVSDDFFLSAEISNVTNDVKLMPFKTYFWIISASALFYFF